MASFTKPGLGSALISTTGALCLAGLFLFMADASPMWAVLVLLAVVTVAALAWSGDMQTFLLCGYFLTLPINISKSVVAEGGMSAPGFYIVLSDMFLGPLLLLWLVDRTVLRPDRVVLHPLHKVAAVYILWKLIGLFYTPDLLQGGLAGLFYVKFFVASVLVADIVRTPRQVRYVLYAMAAALSLQTAFVGAQTLTGSFLGIQGLTQATDMRVVFSQGTSAIRPGGFLGHPNTLADYLSFSIPLLFVMALLGSRYIGAINRLAALALMAAASGALIVTLSRGGWIATSAAILFVVAVSFSYGLITVRRLVGFAAFGFVGLAVLIAIYPEAVLRLTESDDRSTEARVVLLQQAWLIIKENPIVGVGFGGYQAAAAQHIPPAFAGLHPMFREALLETVVHNKYMSVFAEHGIVGLALFVWIMVRGITLVFPLRRWHDPTLFGIGLGLSAGLFAQSVFFLTDHFYVDVRNALYWMTLGLVVAVVRVDARKGPVPDTAPGATAGLVRPA